ncbi:AMP-binding protein [Sulfolobus acidocaldarius]|uniref:AMP-binding protein n=1 Tax=Sulfolobus acidocaldarius TaxID=2285 RepID=UPI000782BBA4|nr:AMP-binding protein [Sulfolobus acidocaldarius]
MCIRDSVYGDNIYTYKEVYERVVKLANSLHNLGIKKGTTIGVADWNTNRFVELLYASALLGCVIYPVNIRLPPEQIIWTIKFANVEWLFISRDFEALSKVFDSSKVVYLDGNNGQISYEDLISKGAMEKVNYDVKGGDPYSILFTSGTTGKPKAVMYTHEKVIHGALSIVHQLGLYNSPAKLSSNDVIMPFIPFYHLWSWGSAFIASYLGAKYVLTGKFDPKTAIQLIKRENATWINAVPTMIQMILSSGEQLPGVKALIGGQAIPYNVAKSISDAGLKFSTIYGGTDMLAISISIIPGKFQVNDDIDYLRTTTHPVPFVEVKVIKPDGTEASYNEIGELYVRAPWLPGSYYNNPEETQRAYDENGWFKTGDLAIITEEGGLRIVDRLKDVIKSGGEWIPSSVLESIISEIPAVEQVAVLGYPDQKWGERPMAVVKLKPGQRTDQKEILEYLRDAVNKGRINKWWLPDKIVFVDNMPLTSTGKINKLALRKDVGIG